MTKQNRNTANALKALAIKRAIPPGLIAVQLTIQLPHRLVARVRSATPVKRGQMLEAGVKAMNLENLEDEENGNE